MKNIIISLFAIVLLQACSDNDEFELKKYYKDPASPAAQMMGGTYAGVVATFNSIDACFQMKNQVEKEDKNIGYTNSRFVCDIKE